MLLVGLRLRRRHAEEGPGLVGDVLEVDEAAALADHVEEITMLAGCSVGPFAGGALRRVLEPDIHRATRRVAHVAHQPVAALEAAGGEIVAAHCLGLPAQPTCKIGSDVAGHYAASRSETPPTG